MPRKFMVFSCDDSLSAIGGPQKLVDVFGVPPMRITHGVAEFAYYLNFLVKEVEEKEVHPIFGEMPSGKRQWVLNEKAQALGLSGIIVDNLSFLAQQTREWIMAQSHAKSMDQQKWGLFGDSFMRAITMLWRCNFPVICTAHLSRDKDENGSPIDKPLIKGSSEEQLPGYFDVVAYTRLDRDDKGNVRYRWQIRGDQRRIYAKDRLNVTGETWVEQDLDVLLRGYEDQGIGNAKILIIGEPGQGKTTSLATATGQKQAKNEGAA